MKLLDESDDEKLMGEYQAICHFKLVIPHQTGDFLAHGYNIRPTLYPNGILCSFIN